METVCFQRANETSAVALFTSPVEPVYHEAFFYENSLLTCASFFIKFLFNAPPLIMTIIEKQTTVSARHKHSFQSHIQTSYVLWKKFKPQWNQWKCIYLDDKIWTHFLSWLRTNWCFFQCSTTENIDGNNCIIFVITFFLADLKEANLLFSQLFTDLANTWR